jgi:RND family efflux transporter MFP subunit
MRFITGAGLMALLLLTAVWLPGCEAPENKYVAPPPPKVTVAPPVVRDVTASLVYTGTTRAFESVDIRARVQGMLRKMDFVPSSMVKKGDLLFVIEPEPFQAKVDEALADLAVARAQLKLSEATLKRKANAYKERAVSEVEVLTAEAERDKAKAAIKASQAKVEVAKIDLGYTHIHAPISGRISRNLVDLGNLVGRGEATLLSSIVNDKPMLVYFNISERDILEGMKYKDQGRDFDDDWGNRKVYLGMADEKGFPHKGFLDYIDNVVDSSTGTISVRGNFPNKESAILPGLFVRVRIPVRKLKNALLVPQEAVGADQAGQYLLVVNAKNEVEYRKVGLGPVDQGMVSITKGLKAGERVIVQGLQRARPGIKVTPVEQEQKTQAPTPVEKGKGEKAAKAEEAGTAEKPAPAKPAESKSKQ